MVYFRAFECIYNMQNMSDLSLRNTEVGETEMPSFRTKKQVYEWIKTGDKTLELRKGKSRKGDAIIFLNGKGRFMKGRILRKREGKLEQLLNSTTYKSIVPTAKSLDEAFAFIRQIYPSSDGTFTTYKFRLDKDSKQ